MQKNATVVLFNNEIINEEASIVNFLNLNICEAHEQLVETSVVIWGLDVDQVMLGINIYVSNPFGEKRLLIPLYDCSMKKVSEKVVWIIHSYRDYDKRVDWKEFS